MQRIGFLSGGFMKNEQQQQQILAFAGQIGSETRDPFEKARSRNWLNSNGGVTEEGARLLEALADQTTTRTVFRGNF
jgi:hypothetical protein